MKQKTTKLDRRSFIEQTAKLTVGGFMLSQLTAKSKNLSSIEGEIKVAVVGCGGRGTGAATQALEADKDVRIVAMADVFLDQASNCLESLNEKYGETGRLSVNRETLFTGFDGYIDAINLADVVILTTPPAFRPLHFEYAVKKNKHIFMEKPVATDVAGIQRIIRASKLAREKKVKYCCWTSKALPKKLSSNKQEN